MKTSHKVKIGLIILAVAAVYYYISLPAINLHSTDTWFFLFAILFVIMQKYYVAGVTGGAVKG